MTILLIDDSLDIRQQFGSFLKQSGYPDILAATSWAEARHHLEARDDAGRSDLALILLDLVLPGMNGLDVCRLVKADPALMDVPIIILADTGSADLEEAFEVGAMDFIRKPIDRIELLARVRSALSLKRELETSRSHERTLLKLTEELTIANATLERLSLRDALTGIPNRRAFDDFLERSWRQGARGGLPVSLILLDVDLFKAYNDHFGHQAGDECLVKVARAIAGEAKRPGDMPARYGGEEFAVILGDTSMESALVVAQNMHAAIARLALPHPMSSVAPHVTVSLGVATLVPISGMERDALIGKADGALYLAKGAGRNCTWSQDNCTIPE